VTDCAVVITTVQVVLEPLHAPLQPANVDPESALAISVTGVPSANEAEHVVPQSIPAGRLVTTPVPVPIFETARA
jgi:hypothetical protein